MPLFQERQFLASWVYLTMFASASLPVIFNAWHPAPGGIALPVALVTGVLVFMLLLLGSMETRVFSDRVVVTFGALRLIRYTFLFTEITKIVSREYAPIGEFGGWGIRGFDNKRALNMRGKFGVELTLERSTNSKRQAAGPAGQLKTSTMMIGSQRADELTAAIRQAMGV